jgi:hypothetical protein
MVDSASYLRENTEEKLSVTPLEIGSMMPELDIGDNIHDARKGVSTAQASAAGDMSYLDQCPSGKQLQQKAASLVL